MNIADYDNTITNAMFLTKVDNIYVMLHSAIMKRDMDIVKHKISDNIYNYYENIVNDLKNNHEIQMYGEFNISSSNMRNIKIDENFIIVEVDMLTRFLDYVIDEDSKKIKRGVNDHRKEQHDILTFIKKIDAKPLEPSRHCPNCGASMDISKTGKCDYCNAIFNTLDYDYVLTKIN